MIKYKQFSNEIKIKIKLKFIKTRIAMMILFRENLGFYKARTSFDNI